MEKTNDSRFPFKLHLSNVRKIFASVCPSWKKILVDKWGTVLFSYQYDYIVIEEAFYKEMRKACTPEQHKLFDDIFGVDEEWFPGELYWVSEGREWSLRYAAKEVERFYLDQSTSGYTTGWNKYQLAKGVKLPE